MCNGLNSILWGAVVGVSVSFASLVNPTPAAAQATEGQELQRGIAAGPLLITPRLRLGVGYDTNVNLNAGSEYSATSPELVIAPSIGLSMRESGMVRFDAGAGITWRQYVGGEQGSTDASGLDANAHLDLQVNHSGAVSFVLKDRVRQSNDAVYQPDLNDDPYEINFTDYGLDLGSGRVLTNNASMGINFHPGGDTDDSIGFIGSLTAKHQYNHYQERPSQDRQRVGGELRLGWRFLPRSVVFADVSASRVLYRTDEIEPITRDRPYSNADSVDTALRNNESTPVYAGVGLRSLILPRLGLMTRIGYSTAFYDDGASPKRFAFQLQADAELTSTQSLRGGYATNFADSTFANYLVYHRFHLSYMLSIQPIRFTISAFAQINQYAETDDTLIDGTGALLEQYNTTSRRDIPIGASTEVSVDLGQHVLLGLNYSILANISNFDAEPARDWLNQQKLSGSPEFLRHRVYLFVALAL